MTLAVQQAGERLVPVNWDGIRPEYFKVWADFPLVAGRFGITLTDQQSNALGHMLVAVDRLDRSVDSETDQESRLELCQCILDWLGGQDEKLPPPLEEFADELLMLRRVLAELDVTTPFVAASSKGVDASEAKRNAVTTSAFVRHALDEGRSAAEMFIALLGDNTNERFDRFLTRLIGLGILADTLMDAEEDFGDGSLQIQPGRMFRWRLRSAIARRLPGLILGFPDRPWLWRYCRSYRRSQDKPFHEQANPPAGQTSEVSNSASSASNAE